MSTHTPSARRRQLEAGEDGFAFAAPSPSPMVLRVGSEVRLVVLAPGIEECAALDRASGAFVWIELLGAEPHQLQRFDVVAAQLTLDDEIPDPARPEAVRLGRPLETVGRFRGRGARRFLNSLVLPPGQPFLGFPGPSTRYWSITGTSPSLALIVPDRGPQLLRRRDGNLKARFLWGGVEHQLAVGDPQLVDAMLASGAARLSESQLESALGFRPEYLLIALTPPIDGHCYKTVAAALPKP